MSQPQEASRVEILDAMEGPRKFLSIPKSFIACHSKESFLHDPARPSSEQPPFHLYGSRTWTKNKLPFPWVTIGNIIFGELFIWNYSISHFSFPNAANQNIFDCYLDHFKSIQSFWKCIIGIVGTCNWKLASFYITHYCDSLTRFYYELMTSGSSF